MRRKLGTVAVAGLTLALLGFGPLGPCAGGALSGATETTPVTDWGFTAEIEQIQLETNPSDPYSVNAWCVGIGERLYVPSSMIRGPKTPNERAWVKNVTQDPRVRVLVGDEIYERVATRVEDPAEYEATRSALERKYELDPAERDPEREIWIYRLDPRSS